MYEIWLWESIIFDIFYKIFFILECINDGSIHPKIILWTTLYLNKNKNGIKIKFEIKNEIEIEIEK